MRRTVSLSGTWQFQLDPEGLLTPETLSPDREITVPLPWQVAFPELAQYSGYAWYRRTVDIDEELLKGDLLLRFGAVDYWCVVFVNGQPAGEHEGGYTPIELSIRKHARPGPNEITVQVYDAAQTRINVSRWPMSERQDEMPGPPFNPEDVPHGKQDWYINVGGIWQDVELVAVSPTYIDLLHVTPDIHSGAARVQLELAGAAISEPGGAIQVSINAEGVEAGHATISLEAGRNAYTADVSVANARLWRPEDPYLYTATATLQAPDSEDELRTRFGFREISTSNGQILLNGEPLFLLCALDQDLYPDTIYTVPSEEFLRDQFEKARQLGLNSLRCHIKPPDPRYLDLADEMGLLIWAEIPSWRTFQTKPFVYPEQIAVTEQIKHRVERTLEEMVRRDLNHPSLVIWTIVNEDWGTSLPLSSEDRAWVAQMYERCKELDPTRLVVDNSACPHAWGPNIHVHTDLEDFHIYANIPDQARNWEQAIDQFALRPLWTYSTHDDTRRTGHEPLVLSEFGNWGLPSLKALREHYGGDPGWFDIGAWWSPWEGLSGWATGVEERFKALGLDAIWGDYEKFASATQWHQFEAMKFEIEAMRRQPSLAGYVITEFTDAYWESNGLLDFARNPKVYHDRFASINSPDMIVPRPSRYVTWDDQPLTLSVFVAHYSPADWGGAHLCWRVDGGEQSGEWEVPDVPRGEVKLLRTQYLKMPQVDRTREVKVQFVLEDPAGGELAENSMDILVMPSEFREASYPGLVSIITNRPLVAEGADQPPARPPETLSESEASHNDDSALDQEPPSLVEAPALERLISNLGYKVTGRLDAQTGLAITDYPNAKLLEWVRQGGKLLYISSGPGPFFWAQNRSGAYSGSWITSFSWLRGDFHRRLKVKNPLGLPFKDTMPRSTILGLPYEDPRYQPDFLSGMISGWVHQPSVHTVQFRYGRGAVIMTTFAIENGLHINDPIATAMLHDLVDYLCSDTCHPILAANY